MAIQTATKADIPQLVDLLNSSYRGELSTKGWTSEAHLVKGDLRTDTAGISKLFNLRKAGFLKFVNDNNIIVGCVFLHVQGKRLYLGMLSVHPLSQSGGIGKQLMQAAGHFARAQKCSAIFIRVISIRHELIAWYERQGYANTGVSEPFPADPRFGIPVQPLRFIIMEKRID